MSFFKGSPHGWLAHFQVTTPFKKKVTFRHKMGFHSKTRMYGIAPDNNSHFKFDSMSNLSARQDRPLTGYRGQEMWLLELAPPGWGSRWRMGRGDREMRAWRSQERADVHLLLTLRSSLVSIRPLHADVCR